MTEFPYPATPEAVAVFFLRMSLVGVEAYIKSLHTHADAAADPEVASNLRYMAEGASHVFDGVRNTLNTYAPIKES